MILLRIILNKMDTIPNRNTKQRQVVLTELRNVYSHPTAQQIHKLVNKGKNKIALATVYRTLDFLEGKGLIIKLRTKNKEARYDGNPERHCHLFCKKCGHVDDIFDITNIFIGSKALKKSKFRIHYDFLELHGLCHSCQ